VEDLKNNLIIKALITWLCDCVYEVVHCFVSNIIMLREAVIGPALYSVFFNTRLSTSEQGVSSALKCAFPHSRTSALPQTIHYPSLEV